MPFSTKIELVSFIEGGNWGKPQTCHKYHMENVSSTYKHIEVKQGI